MKRFKAMKKRPNSTQMLQWLSTIVETLAKINRFEDALQSFDKAIQLKPDYAMAFNNRGKVLAKINRFEDALQSYDKAIQLNPDDAMAFVNRGIVLHELNR